MKISNSLKNAVHWIFGTKNWFKQMSAEDNFLRLQEGFNDTEIESLVKEGYFSAKEIIALKNNGFIDCSEMKNCLEILKETNYG